MIKELLTKWDEKEFYSDYSDSSNYFAHYFCSSCIVTGSVMAIICISISILLRNIGVSDWFLDHYLVRGLTFIILGGLTTCVASTFGKEGMNVEANQFVLSFVFFSVISTMTLLSDKTWAMVFLFGFFTLFLYGLYGNISEKLYWRITTFIPIVATVLYLIAGICLVGISFDNFFDFVFGAYLTFIVPYSFGKVVLFGLTIYDIDETDKDVATLYKAIRKYPLVNGYIMGKSIFLMGFLNIGEIMSEFDGSSKK